MNTGRRTDEEIVDALNRNTAAVRRLEAAMVATFRTMAMYIEEMRKIYDELLAIKKKSWWKR